jgi:hypothetical protein
MTRLALHGSTSIKIRTLPPLVGVQVDAVAAAAKLKSH